MKTSVLTATLLLCFNIWSVGQESTSSIVPEAALQHILPGGIRADMTFLADDLLEGRGTGTRGFVIAAKYAASQFQEMGLKPAGENGTYFQTIRFRQYKLISEQSSMTLLRAGQAEKLTEDKDCVVVADPVHLHATVEADVIFVGYGVTAPEFQYDDYTGIDAKGKVVVTLYGAPSRFGSAPSAYYSDPYIKKVNAAAHGAIGIITVVAGPVAEHVPFLAIVRSARAPHMRWLDEKGLPNDVVPEIRGNVIISVETAKRMLAESAKSLDEVLAKAKAGEHQAFPLGMRLQITTVSQHNELESSNVAAVLRGSDPKLSDEYVAMTAHLDHLGIGESIKGDTIYNGALDNASGSATLLEIARSLSTSQTPRRSLLFILVTGEEEGLLGSDYFAHHMTVPTIVANVNIDEIPMLYDFKDIVAYGAEHSSIGRIVENTARRFSLEVSPDPAPEEVNFIRSDQYSFVKRGIPSVEILGGFKAVNPRIDGKKVFENWESTRYHQPTDDMSQPLDFKAAAKYARLVLGVGYELAQENEPPHWNPGDFFVRFSRDKDPRQITPHASK